MVHPHECDLSPELPKGYNVSAYIGALTKPSDTEGKYAVTGATVSVTTTDGEEISAITDDSGLFTLESVPSGEYTATVTYPYGFERTFTIIVNDAEVSSTVMVGIVPCNWDGNNTINVADKNKLIALIGLSKSDESYDSCYDIDRSGNINVIDKSVYVAFSGYTSSSVIYADTVIS